MSYRRLVPLLVVLAAVAVPAVVLDAACIGNSCDDPTTASADVPFCSLPEELRVEIAAGYREQRSPDVLVVPDAPVLWGWNGPAQRGVEPAWPSAREAPSGRVPIVFAGHGVHGTAPEGVQLTAIAPTVLRALGTDWAFPGVHPGEAIELTTGRPRLVVVVALKAIGSAELEARPDAWPFLRSLLRRGAGTLDADAGSLPLDPAATLTSIGTGALPSDHGITGTWLRNDDRGGALARAWSPDAPASVIATFADDLEAQAWFAGRARVALVADDRADLGLIGRDWYASGETDEVSIVRRGGAAAAAERFLSSGFGDDQVADVLGVVVRDSIAGTDAQLRAIVERADEVADGRALVVVAGTGSATGPGARPDVVPPSAVVEVADSAIPGSVPAVEGTQPGGLFLDQEALTEAGAGSGTVAQAVLGAADDAGRRYIADAFGGFAVQFGRFC